MGAHISDSYYQSLKVFISSPNDVPEERAIAEKAIALVNLSCRDTLGIHIEPHSWSYLPPFATMSEDSIQDVINKELRTCNVFVLILNRRYGSLNGTQRIGHTESEINIALKMVAKGSMLFLSYFRELPAPVDPGPQQKRVRQLQAKLAAREIFSRKYKEPSEFKEQFTHDLYHNVLKFFLDVPKQEVLKRFWNFGVRDGKTHPQLNIVYPPLDRYFMRHDRDCPDEVWLERLVPHVVFEDFKAMQKVEKTLRLIGFRDFDFCSTSASPNDIDDHNRLWLCLPRNPNAQAQLELYDRRARFRFEHRSISCESRIHWRSHSEPRGIVIESPLGKYLREQRRLCAGGDWTRAHGNIFAKDFAVLARFSDRHERFPMRHGRLKDFFLAGIRGLGTWGAGWFIDRKYNRLNRYTNDEDADIQLLLEVTYQNEHIRDVQIVSEKPEKYFQDENDPETIRRRIAEHTNRFHVPDERCADQSVTEPEPVFQS